MPDSGRSRGSCAASAITVAVYDVCIMERTNIYLDEQEVAALRMLSRRTGRPVAALVREAVDAWLDARGVRVISEDEWTRRFAELLGRRGRLAAAEGWSEEQVAPAIARAVAEVRRSRAAGRR
jgi:hypothetical protein